MKSLLDISHIIDSDTCTYKGGGIKEELKGVESLPLVVESLTYP